MPDRTFFIGGADTPDIYNTISREYLNHAYNPRFYNYTKKAEKYER